MLTRFLALPKRGTHRLAPCGNPAFAVVQIRAGLVALVPFWRTRGFSDVRRPWRSLAVGRPVLRVLTYCSVLLVISWPSRHRAARPAVPNSFGPTRDHRGAHTDGWRPSRLLATIGGRTNEFKH